MTHSLPLRVLIVDDHAMARQIVFNAMQDENVAHVEMAGDGNEAKDKIYAAYDAGKPYHIIFLDWDMPVMTGLDVLKHFRLHPEFNKTAFVMLTAESEQGEVVMAAKSGATSYIVKPAPRELIIKKFHEVIEWLKKNHAVDPKLFPTPKPTH